MTNPMTQAEAEMEAQQRQIVSANEQLVKAVLARAEREKALAAPMGGADVAGKELMGAFSGASKALSGFAGGLPMAAMGALEGAFGFAAKSLNTFNDSTLSASQKARHFAEGLPVVGGLVKSFNDLVNAMSGLEDQFRRDAIKRSMNAALIPLAAGIERQRLGLGVGLAGAAGLAGAMGAVPGQIAVGGDRNTVAGQLQYERERMMAPMLLQQEMARSRVAGAGEAEAEARKNQLKARDALDLHRRNRNNLVGDLWEAGDDRGRISGIRTRINKEDLHIEEARKSYSAGINESRQRGLELAQRESELRKAGIELQKAELALLEQKEQRLHGQLNLLGNMTRGGRASAVRAAERIDRVGWDQAGPAARSLAMQLNPDKAALLSKRAAEASGVMDRLPGDWRREGTRAGLDRDVRGAEAQVRELVRFDNAKMAAGMKQVMDSFAASIVDAMRAAVSDAKAKIENANRIQNNQR